ncbi:hypothetical protein [Ponticoccus litoralis]|uniref:Uncharacterized protein n=1 Tax=Ponticoccus litoralis TaxID=422297 RepID=A0AAW9SG75_9RHOB
MARWDQNRSPFTRIGFRGRLILLGLLASLLAALMVGTIGYRATDHAARDGASALLAAEARLNAERVMAPLDTMRTETEIFARLPIVGRMAPGSGLPEAQREDLKHRLALVFSTLLSERPAYFRGPPDHAGRWRARDRAPRRRPGRRAARCG